MKKKLLALLLAAALCLGLAAPALALEYGEEYRGYTTATSQQYRDVTDDHWAKTSIETCSQRSWFNGYPDGTFRPEGLITREEAAKVFAVAMGLEIETDPEITYTDTKDNWAKAYIEATKSLFPNVANLQGTTSFRPKQTITREETIYALVIAWGYGSKAKNADLSVLNMFSDTGSISAGVKPYMAVGVSEGLVSGLPDGTIAAQKGLTRAEFATLLARALSHGYGDTKQEFQAPAITLDKYPAATAETQVSVTGTVTPADASLKLDGKSVKAGKDGSFTLALELETGKNTFTLTAENAYGTKDSKNIAIERTEEAVTIRILSDVPETTQAATLAVNGKVENWSDACTLLLDNTRVSVDKDGYFQLTLQLEEGRNAFALTVARGQKEVGAATIQVTRAASEPAPEVTNPPSEKPSIVIDRDIQEYCPPGVAPSVAGHIENYSKDCGLYNAVGNVITVEAGGYFTHQLSLGDGGQCSDLLLLEYQGQIVDQRSLSSYTSYTAQAGQWLTELPDEVANNPQYYDITTKVEYRYKTIEHTTSSATTMAGWTLQTQGGSWGAWSSWQDAPVSGSSTRKVETRVVEAAPGKTEYRYGGWHDSSNYGHFCPDLGKSDRGTSFTLHYTNWSTTRQTPKYTNWQYCDNSSHNHVGGRWYNGHHYWDRYGIDGLAYYWEETRTSEPTYKTQYRYQDYDTNNVFVRESEWSDWTEKAREPGTWSGTEDQRTLYYYIPLI